MRKKAFIASLLALIEQNLNREIAIQEIVNKSGYSRWYLQRLFKQETGYSLRHYILLRRLTMSATTLCEGNSVSITDISERYYFSSPQYFCRTFRKQFGYTPSQYRQLNAVQRQNIPGLKTVPVLSSGALFIR